MILTTGPKALQQLWILPTTFASCLADILLYLRNLVKRSKMLDNFFSGMKNLICLLQMSSPKNVNLGEGPVALEGETTHPAMANT